MNQLARGPLVRRSLGKSGQESVRERLTWDEKGNSIAAIIAAMYSRMVPSARGLL